MCQALTMLSMVLLFSGKNVASNKYKITVWGKFIGLYLLQTDHRWPQTLIVGYYGKNDESVLHRTLVH